MLKQYVPQREASKHQMPIPGDSAVRPAMGRLVLAGGWASTGAWLCSPGAYTTQAIWSAMDTALKTRPCVAEHKEVHG